MHVLVKKSRDSQTDNAIVIYNNRKYPDKFFSKFQISQLIDEISKSEGTDLLDLSKSLACSLAK